MTKKTQNIEKKILGRIKSGEIQMEPRWKFVARVWEQRLMWVISILAAGLSISGIGYFAHRYDPKALMEYGSIGWQVFYEDFPYYWLIGAIVFWILAIKTWLKLGSNYRVTTQKLFIGTGLLLVTIIALALFLS